MSALTDHVLFNAAIATLLAPIAFASRFLGRPVVTHVLWLIVLARLVVPPVWFFSIPAWYTVPVVVETLPVAVVEEPAFEEEIVVAPIDESTPLETAITPVGPTFSWSVPWWEVTVSIWALVAVAFWGRLLFHALRFQQLLCYAEPTNEPTNELVAKLSRRLGLNRPPRVAMVPARLSPCVWCFSARPVLLLPCDWTARQHRLNCAAVLVHELAHLRRGDHWVRWFELVVTGLFWWLPTVWFARKHLREAEELCCDSWVIATLPAARQAYATALVDMADYLAPLRPALPPLASGFGQVHELKRRLHMILHVKPATKAGRSGAAIALGLGLFLLPVGWVRSQERDEPQPRAERRESDEPAREERERQRDQNRERAAEERARARAEQDSTRATDNRDRAESVRRDAMRADLRDQLVEAQKRLADAQRAIERIRVRMNELGIETREIRVEGRGRGGEAPRPGDPVRAIGSRSVGGFGEGGGRGGSANSRRAQPSADQPPETPRPPRAPAPPRAPRAPEPPATPTPPEPAGSGSGPAGPRGFGGGRGTPTPFGPRGGDDRVQQLERQLEMLRKELDAMRREMRRDGRDNDRRDNERRPDNRPPE